MDMTTNPRRLHVAADAPSRIVCPDWCTVSLEQHAAEQWSDPDLHYGPTFGPLQPTWDAVDDRWSVNVLSPEVLDVEQARQLAIQAAAAVEWIEAQMA